MPSLFLLFLLSFTHKEYNAHTNFTIEITDTNADSLVSTDMLVSGQVAPVEGKADAGFAAFRSTMQKPKSATAAPTATDETGLESSKNFNLGDRVKTKGGLNGAIRYIGKVESLPKGYFLGIQLDEEKGKNDGEVKGIRIFTCKSNYGMVLRPDDVSLIPDISEEF